MNYKVILSPPNPPQNVSTSRLSAPLDDHWSTVSSLPLVHFALRQFCCAMLNRLMKAELQLIFTPLICCLPHDTQLYFTSFLNYIPQSSIQPVSVKNFHTIAIPRVSLPIDEDLIVQC